MTFLTFPPSTEPRRFDTTSNFRHIQNEEIETAELYRCTSLAKSFVFTENKWITITLIFVLSFAYFLHNYKVIPNPITLIFNSPTTNLSSDADKPGFVIGSNLQRTSSVPNVTSQPLGQVIWTLEPGFLDGLSRPTIADNILSY